jgi:dynein heavy chain 2
MNPKAQPRHQLLGSLNPDTREWSDGVLTAAARRMAREAPEQRSWVVCDGDVDPEWIESLNSVLDDNRWVSTLKPLNLSSQQESGLSSANP